MSSNDSLIIIYPKIIKYSSQYFLPFLLTIGNISCILSLFVFFQKNMRKNPSGLYFLSFTLCNLIYINIVLITTILFFGFHINPTGEILIICQFQFYIGFVVSFLSSTFLLLASIDRFLMTSSNFTINHLSTRSIAIKLIIGLTIFSCIIHIHSFFFIVKKSDYRKSFSCSLQPGAYILALSWYIFIFFGFLTPLLMILFGIRTIINVRRVMFNPMSRLYSIDRQLILIMLSQCFIHIVFRLPLAIYFIYDYITKNSVQDLRYYIINLFFFYISLICFCIPYCTFFFSNLISQSFRTEFKRLVKRIWIKKIKQQHVRRIKKQRQQRIYPVEIIQRQVPIEMTLR